MQDEHQIKRLKTGRLCSCKFPNLSGIHEISRSGTGNSEAGIWESPRRQQFTCGPCLAISDCCMCVLLLTIVRRPRSSLMRSNKPIEDREENNQSAFSAPVFDYVVTAY